MTTTVEAPAPLTTTDVERYVEDGFLVRPGLVSEDDLQALEAEMVAFARGRYPVQGLEPVAAEVPDHQAAAGILCIHQPHWVSPLIRRMVGHPGIAATLSACIAAHLPPSWQDGSVKCMQSMFFAKGPDQPGQAWHQDEIYIPTRDRSLAGAWIAIDDATIDNGCLWVLPGSHRRGVLYPQRQIEGGEFDGTPESHGFDDAAEVAVEVPRGTVVFFNGYLLHRSKRNRSGRYRRVLVNHYLSGPSLLPWGATTGAITRGETTIAKADERCVDFVAGSDPYAAWADLVEPSGVPHLRHHLRKPTTAVNR